jgi:hypothetical protein
MPEACVKQVDTNLPSIAPRDEVGVRNWRLSRRVFALGRGAADLSCEFVNQWLE